MTQPRVRIAPSPTGNLHVGTARTALFNYLFARKHNGKFILRIEDTDFDRSKDEYVQNIFDSLHALGLNWDEGPDAGGEHAPYSQSQRLELYKQKADELVQKGLAYYCYCSQEELDQEKEQAKLERNLYVYSRKCLNLSDEQRQKYIDEGRIPTIRFKVPHIELVLNDIIRGQVSFDTALIGDFVIMKSNGTPTYNFAVVVDDIDMKITHVIRGEDHISNTPRQIMLYEAFESPLPQFAHVGMILAPDKSKLSKRHGATAVNEFIDAGYLPEAFVNYLALLGWSTPDGEEVKSLEEIISVFELEKVSHSAAVFDKDKLNWLNGMYIRKLDLDDIVNRTKKYLEGYDLSRYTEQQLIEMIKDIRERLSTLAEVKEAVSFFFVDKVDISDEVKEEALASEHVKPVLEKFVELVDELNFDNLEEMNEQFKTFRKSLKPLKPKLIMWPIRAALTGQVHGADLNVCIKLLGRDTVKQRIKEVINTL